MATITTTLTTQFKQDCLDGVHQPGDVYKLILIKPGFATNWDATAATYAGAGSMADEVATGGGYAQGGIALSGRTSGQNAGGGYVDFADISVSASTISAAGALIVNTTRSNKICSCHDFGGTITSTNDVFSITIPATGTGLLRFN